MRLVVVAAFLAGCQLVFELEEPTCPGSFDGKRHHVSTTTATWGDAAGQCMALDPRPDDATFTHLAVFTDSNEMISVGLTDASAWIGLFNVNGTWQWVTDEFPDDSNAVWGQGKPTTALNLCGNLDLATVSLDDAGCGMEKPFVCECDEFSP